MADKLAHSSSRWRQKKYIKAILGILVSLFCLWWVLHSVEKEEIFAAVRNIDPIWILAALLTTLWSYVLRAWRWPFFFGRQPPNFYDSFRCLIIGFFMNNMLPARMGEIVRAYLGSKATKQSGTIVLATIAAERLADGLAISLLFAVLFTFTSHPDEIERAQELYIVAYLFLFAAVITGVVLYKRQAIFSFLEKLGQIMPGHISNYTLVRIKRFIQGLEPLFRPSSVFVLSIFSLVVWLVELLVYYEVSVAFGYRMTLGGLSLFLAAVNFSSLIPAAPGGIGVIEAFATFALVRIGVNKETALAMVAAQHLIQYTVVGIPGAFYFFVNLGGKIPESVEAEMRDENGVVVAKYADVSQAKPTPIAEASFSSSSQVDLRSSAPEEIDISIVIPAYNEEYRLPTTLLSVLEYIKTRPENFEVLVVDDGSTDGTSKVAKQFTALSPSVRLLVYPGNRGKGYAVRFGIMNARGQLVLYNDADGATPIQEIERLEEALAGGVHVAIGSRAMYSRSTAVQTVWYRKYIGRVFNGIVNMLLLPGIADTQCGFKMFLRPVARYLFSRTKADRFSFDVEVLFLARKAGLKMVEVPVNWTNVPGSKINLAVDSASMFLDLLKFRLRDLFGAYGHVTYEEFLREGK
jgi:dolichyl-phosphate beta-glucosyltransferase